MAPIPAATEVVARVAVVELADVKQHFCYGHILFGVERLQREFFIPI
jgi:hypothetical protein